MVSVYRLANCLGVISRGHCLRRLERILGFPFPTASAVDWARSWAAEPRLDGAMEMSSRPVPHRLRHLAPCIGSVVPSPPRKTQDLQRRRKRSHWSQLDERFAFLMSCQPEYHHVGKFPARGAHILFLGGAELGYHESPPRQGSIQPGVRIGAPRHWSSQLAHQ